MKRTVITVVVAALACVPTAVSAQDCSPENWKACKGRPWVTGASMDTPLGER